MTLQEFNLGGKKLPTNLVFDFPTVRKCGFSNRLRYIFGAHNLDS